MRSRPSWRPAASSRSAPAAELAADPTSRASARAVLGSFRPLSEASMFDPFRKDLLAGKTTIITGGGSGLGRSMALRMAGLGAKVAVLGRRPEPLEETARAIRDAGGAAVGGALRRARSGGGGRRLRRASRRSSVPRTSSSTTQPATSWPRARTSRPTPSTRSCRSSCTERSTARASWGAGSSSARRRARCSRSSPRTPPPAPRSCCPPPPPRPGVLAMMRSPGGGVGGLRHPPERDRPRPLPHRGRVQPADAGLGAREAGPRAASPGGASASTGSSRTSWPT